VSKTGRVGRMWQDDDSSRAEVMKRKRLCAALTKPWLLPPDGQNEDAKLIETYQDIGANGVTALTGHILLESYPLDNPYFSFSPSPEVEYDPAVDPQMLQEAKDQLFLIELALQALMESSRITDGSNRRVLGFRSNKARAIDQYIVLGDVLEFIDSDYRITPIRFDNYVTRRDSSGDVVYHIVREGVDPLAKLDEKQLEQLKIKPAEAMLKNVKQRSKTMYTICEWQPLSKKWLISQEIDGQKFNEADKKFSPFVSTVFELSPPEHYGRSLIEQHLGELRSLNEIEMRALDIIGIIAKYVPVLGHQCLTRPEDLEKPSGVPIRGDVRGGVVQDIGILQPNKTGDMMIVNQQIERKREALGKSFLSQAESLPTGDRVTRAAVDRVGSEIDMARGSSLAGFAEQNQLPTLRYFFAQAQDDKLIRWFSEQARKGIQIRSLTGVAAINRAQQMRRLLTLTQVMQQFGPQMLGRIDEGILAQILVRYSGFYESGLVKTNAQMAKEQQTAMQQQLVAAAGEQAIKTIGNAAEKRLATAPQ